MTPFARQPPPAMWLEKEATYSSSPADQRPADPLSWQHQKRTLADWFHAEVRPASEPRMCAYCDGSLVEQSRETIDHFLPRHEFPELSLSWDNLFPACDRCNSTYKRTRWSCRLVRPDTDPVEGYFDFDPMSGKLRPSAALDWTTRVNVRLTIQVFRLNDPHRCKGRLRVMKECQNAWKRDRTTLERDQETLEERVSNGPYRFVARRVLDAMPESSRVSREEG